MKPVTSAETVAGGSGEVSGLQRSQRNQKVCCEVFGHSSALSHLCGIGDESGGKA